MLELGDGGLPDRDYAYLGKFLGNCMSSLRLSMGDYDLDPIRGLDGKS